ncbi:MAG TPA: hypothetical protein VNO35_18825 [Steroidobacteraceae bacterium]|nr:hypothetical protein [Steroidobacteraceae bacterium]
MGKRHSIHPKSVSPTRTPVLDPTPSSMLPQLSDFRGKPDALAGRARRSGRSAALKSQHADSDDDVAVLLLPALSNIVPRIGVRYLEIVERLEEDCAVIPNAREQR